MFRKRGEILNTVKLGNTDLFVTPLCLGTIKYGTGLPEEDSIRQLYEYTELGGNFLDTAHIYGDWQPGWGPKSEITIGKWIKERGKRDDIVISTKGAHPNIQTMNIPRLGDAQILEDLEDSLKSLQTDYVDLYFLHRDDERRPVEEIVEFLESQVRAGKIRYYGCSNWRTERIAAANTYAKAHGLQGFSCNQLMWSLAQVNPDGIPDKTLVMMDGKTYDYHAEEKLAAMAYMSAAKGYFSKRIGGCELSQSVKNIYDLPANDEIYKILRDAVSEGSGSCTAMDYALRFLMEGHPFASAAIASFSSPEQLREGMHALKAPVDPEVMERLRACRKL